MKKLYWWEIMLCKALPYSVLCWGAEHGLWFVYGSDREDA
jgi:hypothetical protein